MGDAVSYHFAEDSYPSNSLGIFYVRDDLNCRLDNTLFVTLNWQPVNNLIVQPFYRFQYAFYPNDISTQNRRNDYLNSFGLNLIYSFNPHASVRTYFNYTTKTSDDTLTPSYDEVNGGLGVTLDLRF